MKKRELYEIPLEEFSGLRDDFERGMLPHEREFFRVAKSYMGARCFRSGWPDFLLTDGEGAFAVECKSGAYPLSERQIQMMRALETGGIRCYVWWLDRPDELTPWRRFQSESEYRAAARFA